MKNHSKHLAVRWPGRAAGSVNDISIRFAETFLEIAGVKVPDDMQGRGLVPILEGNNRRLASAVLLSHY